MGFALGSFAVMSGYRPLEPSSLPRFFALFELRSMLLAVVVILVLLVLAYLTNPTETSFRAFLTEQAFRHHLTRLDESDAPDELEFVSNLDRARPTFPLTRRGPSNFLKYCTTNAHSSPPFSFANRASISLRTPKHIFRSMGIVSVAAVVSPSGFHRSSANRAQHIDESAARDNDGCSSSASLNWDTWFVGAFGMWFWLANLDVVWRGAGIIAKDEFDGTVSGVLEVKALDRSDEVNGLPTTTNGGLSHGQRQAPKLRSRERFTSQNGHSLNHRSQTPPPLPKSASLPLHAKRGAIVNAPERPTLLTAQSHFNGAAAAVSSTSSSLVQPTLPTAAETWQLNQVSSPSTTVSIPLQSSVPSRSPSVLFASSPLIAEILRQLSASQSLVDELRTQLSDFQTTSAAGHTALDEELEKQREQKRIDDAAKADLKARTKTLDDQKRAAEAARRDAEKRFKTACVERDSVTARNERLEQEIRELNSQIEAQGARVVASGVETSALTAELEKEAEEKRSELRVTEEEVAQLSANVREAEEKIAFEEQRLERAHVKAEARRREVQNQRKAQGDLTAMNGLSNLVNGGIWNVLSNLQTRRDTADLAAMAFPPSPMDAVFPDSPSSIGHSEIQYGPHLPSPGLTIATPSFSAMKNMPVASTYHSYRDSTSNEFVPFSNSPHQTLFSPTGESLLPSSLCESLGVGLRSGAPLSPIGSAGTDLSRSFQSEDDAILNRDWYMNRNQSAGDVGQLPVYSRTPLLMGDEVSTNGSVTDFSPFDTRPLRSERSNLSYLPPMADASPTQSETADSSPAQVETPAVRRLGWFGGRDSKPREKKALNPDAKEFSLSKDKERSFSALLSRSRGNSSSGSSSTPSTASIHTPESTSLINSPASVPASIVVSSTVLVPSSAGSVSAAGPGANTKPLVPARTTASSLLSLGTSWFGASRSAFAPTPLEREQLALARVLGGPANTSLDRLPLASTAAASSSKPSLAHAQSIGLPTRRAWDDVGSISAGRAVGSNFSPFEDEPVSTVLPSSASITDV